MPPDIPIAITGVGAVTPLGSTSIRTVDNFFAGHSGISKLISAEFADLGVQAGAPCACPIERVLPPHQARRLDRCSQLGLIAATEAWTGYHSCHFSGNQIGVVFSTGIGGVSSLIEQLHVLEERGPAKVSPHTVALIMPNAPAAQISLHLGASGWLEAPVSACSGGAEAIARAVTLLRQGAVEVVVAGGAEAILNRFGIAAFAAMQALSRAAGPPEEASRPFDAARSGFVMGEGSGILVLERLEEARQRQATIHGVITGIGSSADASDIVRSRPDGIQALRSMQMALADAGLQAKDLDLIKAHATGTVAGDAAEATALAGLLGALPAEQQPWALAPKAVLGHLISASAPVEILLALEVLNRGELAAQANCPNPIPLLPCPLPKRPQPLDSPRTGSSHTALCNSFGFGGRNVSLVLQGASAGA